MAIHQIESVHLTKVKRDNHLRQVFECDAESYLKLKSMVPGKYGYEGVKYIIKDGILYLEDVFEKLEQWRKRREQERKIDEIMDCASSKYPYTTHYQTIFNSMSLEGKIETVFAMAFRALVHLEGKADKEE